MRGFLKSAIWAATLFMILVQIESATACSKVPSARLTAIRLAFENITESRMVGLPNRMVGRATLDNGEFGPIQHSVVYTKLLHGMDRVKGKTDSDTSSRRRDDSSTPSGLQSGAGSVFANIDIGHIGQGWLITIDGESADCDSYIDRWAFPAVKKKDEHPEPGIFFRRSLTELHSDSGNSRPFGQFQRASSFNDTPDANRYESNCCQSRPSVSGSKPIAFFCLITGFAGLLGFGICHGKLPPTIGTWLLSLASAAIGCFFLAEGFERLGPLF